MIEERKCIDSLELLRAALQGVRQTTDAERPTSSSASTTLPSQAEDSLPSFPSSFPSVKRIPGTRFIVDGFRVAGPWSTSYFLSHFHSDHYTGLTPSWNKGLIFCSDITARLVIECIKVPKVFVYPLPVGETVQIDSCQVILVDANHCPGAVQMLFQVPVKGRKHLRYVHTGDMRYSPQMNRDPTLCDFVGADAVFLDTTYCNPKFVFPTQTESINYVAETIHKLKRGNCQEEEYSAVSCVEGEEKKESRSHTAGMQTASGYATNPMAVSDAEAKEMHLNANTSEVQDTDKKTKQDFVGEDVCCKSEREGCVDGFAEDVKSTWVMEEFTGVPVPVGEQRKNKGSILFLISTYVIGKEKIILAVAKRCNCLIFVDERKFTLLKCLDLDNFGIFTTDPSSTDVHVVSWNFLGETWPFFRPNFGKMEKLLKETGCSRVVGFVPTGWTYEIKKKSFSVRRKGPFEIHLVPYSEHSNYDELRQYIAFLRPKEIIPTVGLEGGDMDSKAVASMRKHFRNLVDETASKRKFIKGFNRKSENMAQCLEKRVRKGIGGSPKLGEVAENKDRGAISSNDHDANTNESLNMQQLSNMSEMETGSKAHTAPNSLVQADPMRAVVGKGAKKRGRESVKLCGSSPNELEESGSPSQKESKLNVEHSKISLILTPENGISESSKNDVEVYSVEKAKQLQTILPPWVSAEQVHCFLHKANGDADLAISLFFEQTVPEVGGQQGEERFAAHRHNPIFRKDNEGSQCTDGMVSLTGLLEDVETGTQRSDTSDQLILSECPTTEPTSIMAVAVDGGGKMLKSVAPVLHRKHKGSQASILSFFKKTNVNDSDAFDLERNSSHQVQAKEPKQAQKPKGDLEVLAVQKPNALDQMLSILEGVLPEVKAAGLLEQAGGDVGAALDLYYRINGNSLAKADTNERSAGSSISQRLMKENTLETSTHVGSEGMQTAEDDVRKLIASSENKDEQSCTQKEVRLEVKACSVALPVLDYRPIEHAFWRVGEPAPYLHLARAFDLVEQERGRLKTSDMLCNMFRSLLALSPEAVLPAVYLATNRIAPDYENVDLNIGGSIVSAAIVEATGTARSKLREMYNKMGDLGDVAQACRQTQSLLVAPQKLSIQQVYSTLLQISKETGSGSSTRKKGLILVLLRACREKEMKYIVRTLVQNMRIGAMMRSVLQALAQATVLHNFSSNERNEPPKAELQKASAAVLEAYNFSPNLDILVPALVNSGIKAVLSSVTISPGTPMKPMLAKIANGIPEVFKHFQGRAFTCEYKYDGQRAQVHLRKDGSMKIFSRNCEDNTLRFPDVVEIIRLAVKPCIEDLILDAEIVAIDRENGNKIMAFQHLSTRERGRSGSIISVDNIKVDVCIYVFDLMYVNGKPLVKMPFRERQKWMHDCFKDCQAGYFGFANEITVEANEANLESLEVLSKVDAFLEEAIGASCEGLMVKALDEDSTYMASKRSDSWLKVKKDYIEGLHDTLDLVPIGAWHGNGRKAGWYSPFLLACYDSDREEFQSVCRVMSGFTDAFYKQMKEFFSGDRILQHRPTYYQTLEDPDIWFSAELVWEIRGADLTVSPVHQAAVGLIHPSRGISMRFPRFIRERSDKKPEDASSPSDISDLFHQQNRKLDIAAHNAAKE